MKNRVFSLIFLSFVVLFCGCKFSSELNDSTSIIVKLPFGQKARSADDVSYFFDVNCYAGESATGEVFASTQAYSGESIVFEDVEPGVYTITIKAYEAQNTDILLYEGQQTQEVIERTKTKFQINLKKLPKNFTWIEFDIDSEEIGYVAKTQCREGITPIGYKWFYGDTYLSDCDDLSKIDYTKFESILDITYIPSSITVVTKFSDNSYESFSYNESMSTSVYQDVKIDDFSDEIEFFKVLNEGLKSYAIDGNSIVSKKYSSLGNSANNFNYTVKIKPLSDYKLSSASINVYSISNFKDASPVLKDEAVCTVDSDNNFIFNFAGKLEKGYYIVKVSMPYEQNVITLTDMVRIDNGYLTSASYSDSSYIYIPMKQEIIPEETKGSEEIDVNTGNNGNESGLVVDDTDENLFNISFYHDPIIDSYSRFHCFIINKSPNEMDMLPGDIIDSFIGTHGDYLLDYKMVYSRLYFDYPEGEKEAYLQKIFGNNDSTYFYLVYNYDGYDKYWAYTELKKSEVECKEYILMLQSTTPDFDLTVNISNPIISYAKNIQYKFINNNQIPDLEEYAYSEFFTEDNENFIIKGISKSQIFGEVTPQQTKDLTIRVISSDDKKYYATTTLNWNDFKNGDNPIYITDLTEQTEPVQTHYINATFDFSNDLSASGLNEIPNDWSFIYEVYDSEDTSLTSPLSICSKTKLTYSALPNEFTINGTKLQMKLPIKSEWIGKTLDFSFTFFDEIDENIGFNKSITISEDKDYSLANNDINPNSNEWHGYKIDFIRNNGVSGATWSKGDETTLIIKLSELTGYQIPTPTCEGYTFGGWYIDKDCKTSAPFIENEYFSIKNTNYNHDQMNLGTVYAKWTANTAQTEYNVSSETDLNHALTEIANSGKACTIIVDNDFSVTETLNIKGNVTIKNANNKNVTITRITKYSMFNITYGNSLTLESTDDNYSLTLDGNNTSNNKADEPLIYNCGSLTINSAFKTLSAFPETTTNYGVIIKNCKSTCSGAAIGCFGTSTELAYLNMTGGTFGTYVNENTIYGNESDSNGGAIYLEYCDATIKYGLFNNNVSKVENNSPEAGGGAIYCTNSNLLISDTQFFENQSKFFGGALCVNSTRSNKMEISNCLFQDNYFLNNTNCYGAAISINTCSNGFDINNTKFTGNTQGSTTSAPISTFYVEESSSDMSLNNYEIKNNNFHIIKDIIDSDVTSLTLSNGDFETISR